MSGQPVSDSDRTRLDKWLWAARFFKHRSAATEAVEGGKVKLNGASAKPARAVKPGDRIDITQAEATISVRVCGIAEKRGPAEQARLLYEESAESIARRETEREARRLAATPGAGLHGRPTKRDRRQIERFQRE
ncbi:MAG: RNA-binding protein [Betaproteobacteria bacterium HGW-Betaproteobacteria-13]|jgi:ribosome-associated heat shock protein Hsp15|nr:MAG: RNA-binding protein [Betaproteobacteria bacterium HGW-Betaproteobacteria-13]